MSANTSTTAPAPRASDSGAARLIAAAAGFLMCYLAIDIGSAMATSSMPLPNSSAADAASWYAQNPASVIVTGLFQLLSVGCLAVFAATLRRTGRIGTQARWAYVAVAAMVVSCVLSFIMIALAGSVSAELIGVLRTANFITGGTAHVAALGVFAVLTARAGGFGKGVRVFGWVAAVPAVASLVSLVVFQASALILLGRVLCMAWAIVAAIAVARAARR